MNSENNNYINNDKLNKSENKQIEVIIKDNVTSIKPAKEPDSPSIGFFKLFSFSTKLNVFQIIIGLIASLFMGITWPLVILVFGESTDTLANFQYYAIQLMQLIANYNETVPTGATLETMVSIIRRYDPSFVIDPKYDVMNVMQVLCQYYAGIALGMFIMSYISYSCLITSSQNQISAIRKAFYRAIMRQNIGWFDGQSSGALNNNLVDDINTIHAGIGDKFGQMLQWFACGIGGVTLAFLKGWKLALVAFSVSPLLGLTMFLLSMAMSRLNKTESKAYGKAGGIAEEVLGAIRTVVSFRGENFEVDRYANNLDSACKAGIRKGLFTGILMGLFNGLMFGSYALGFWYGAKLVRSNELTVGNMLIVFFCCMMGSMGFGQALPHFNTLNRARTAAAKIFEVIKRIPDIDKMSNAGLKPESLVGNISFKNVEFHYPTRPECPVLRGLSLNVENGQTVALVGSSGCGKSSIIQLIQRFYDAIKGEILIDGINIKDLNILWLREQIGVVSQEPILFACSIKENIRYGRLDVTDEEIDKALEMANAKQFVNELPNKLETILGERGAQLSGGQKQRIAIARALVRNPKILLLDEATSALDSESERNVQQALDKACIGRTTVIVAHRLSTIRNANVIFSINQGLVVESGTHEQLLDLNGLYNDLVERQKIKKKDEIIKEESEEDGYVDPKEEILSLKSEKKKSNASSINIEIKIITEKAKNHFFRVLKLNSPETCFIICGCIGALLNGGSQPGFSVLFGYILPAMANPDLQSQERDIQKYVIAMAGLAIATFLANLLQSFSFSTSGERLTKRCRKLTFNAMLRQNMAWFDNPDNNVGALTTRLSEGASAIRGLSGENLGTFCQAMASMGAGVIISFIYTWQISLVILAFIPVIIIGGILHIKLMQGVSNSDKGTLEDSGKIAVETIENIRTVTNLTREETFIAAYNDAISKLTKNVSKKSHVQGLLFAVTQATIFCAYAATFIMAGYLLKNGLAKMEDVFIAFGALIFGAMHLGNALAMAPDYGKGKLAAENMFGLFDQNNIIDSYSQDGLALDVQNIEGLIEFHKVSFKYPLRPNVMILKDIRMDIQPNTTVALVGSSGCGKSTIIQLLQRLYDIYKGRLDIDRIDIKAIKICDLRDLFGLVSQEPILFSYSIKENIAYGDNIKKYSDQQIEDAAKAANIHDFILSLPNMYETRVGEKGSNLSGGQKQRIAIARALLRNPKILMLDEATSALDTESEKIVQDALDKAQEGRTCIVIAHRLSTIQNATKILVFNEGRIAESGTHSELINKSGIYYNMIKTQTQHN